MAWRRGWGNVRVCAARLGVLLAAALFLAWAALLLFVGWAVAVTGSPVPGLLLAVLAAGVCVVTALGAIVLWPMPSGEN